MSAATRVLITGASGFIGRNVMAQLSNSNFEIHAVSARNPKINSDDVTWHKTNLLVPSDLSQLIQSVRPQKCLHLAWYVEHGKFWSAPENLLWVESSLQLIRELACCGCQRIVMSGTCAEYDWRYGWCDEYLTPLNPATLYGVCKRDLMSMASVYCKSQNISFAWGRLFLMYGPSENQKRLVPAAIRAGLDGETFRCTHGRQIRDFLHVADVAAALVALLNSSVEGPVNIGSGEPVEIREVIKTIMQLTDGKPASLGAIPTVADDPLILIPKISRLKDEVRWQPKISLVEGLRQTIEAAKRQE